MGFRPPSLSRCSPPKWQRNPRPKRRTHLPKQPATWSLPLDSPATAQPPSTVPRLLESRAIRPRALAGSTAPPSDDFAGRRVVVRRGRRSRARTCGSLRHLITNARGGPTAVNGVIRSEDSGGAEMRKSIILSAVALLAGGLLSGTGQVLAAAPATLPSAHVWVTTPDGSMRMADLGATPFRPGASTNLTVTVDPSRVYQRMDGFGASITDSSASVLYRLGPQQR